MRIRYTFLLLVATLFSPAGAVADDERLAMEVSLFTGFPRESAEEPPVVAGAMRTLRSGPELHMPGTDREKTRDARMLALAETLEQELGMAKIEVDYDLPLSFGSGAVRTLSASG
ncbi:MAG: hypothetical protein GY719_22695 [bacterium]|nr:hypothetical protein [bacterium]